MSKTDLWIYGDDGCLQKFDAEHCEANKTRSVHSKDKYFGSANLKDGCHRLDRHRKGEVLREQNDIITKKDSDTPNMFRKGFGVLSVKPIRRSSKNKEKRQSLKGMIENLPDLSQDRSRCAITSENIEDDEVVIKVPSDKSDTVCASKFSQEEIPEALHLRITDKSNVSKNHLLRDNTHVTPDSGTISAPALEAITSSQCHNVAFQSNHSCLGHRPKVHVSDSANYLSTTPEGHVQASSNILDDELQVKSSLTEDNIQAARGLGSVAAKPNTLVTLSPMKVLKTPTSLSAVVGFKNISVSPSDVTNSDTVGIHACVPDPKCFSDCDVTSVINSTVSAPQMPSLANQNPLIEYRTDASPTTQLKSKCIQTDSSPTSMSRKARKCSTMTEDEPNRLVSEEMADKTCRVDKSFDVFTAADKEPSNTDSDAARIHACIPDPKCSSDRDITSVIGSSVSVSQMSLLANENSLIKYLTDVSWTTQLMSKRKRTDADPPSKSRKARKRSEGTLTTSKVKRKHKKRRKSKYLKQQVEGLSMTTSKTSLTVTCAESLNSLVSNQSTESLFAGENRITTKSANVQYASTESGRKFTVKTEPSNHDEFSAAIFGNRSGIKSEPLDDDEYASAQCQNKDNSYKLPESRNTCLRSLSKPDTETSLTDGATKTRKHTSDTFSGITASNGLSSNVSCKKSGDTQQLQQPDEQISPQPISLVTPLQTDSSLPIKISSVFSLKSHSHNMSIQDIVNIQEQDKGASVSAGTSSEICSDYANSKNFNTIKYPKAMKNDPCLRSLCRVVLEKMQMKNGRVVGSKCTKTCRQRFLSTKKKFDISRNKRNNANNGASCMPVIPQMRIRTGYDTMGLNATNCHSSLPVSTRTRVVHSATRTIVAPVGLPPYAPRTVPYQQTQSKPMMIRSFPRTQLSSDNSGQKKYYMINVQGRNIVIPSVRLNTPRIGSYQQTLKRLTTRSFPGMQLPKTSSGHQSSNSSHAPYPPFKTEPKTQRRDNQPATLLHVAKPDKVGAEAFTKNIGLSYLPGFRQYVVKKTLCGDQNQ